jgi:hypothetical protein
VSGDARLVEDMPSLIDDLLTSASGDLVTSLIGDMMGDASLATYGDGRGGVTRDEGVEKLRVPE